MKTLKLTTVSFPNSPAPAGAIPGPKTGGGITQDQLDAAVQQALENAKKTGEFDGPPGRDGVDGKPGQNGSDGKPGKDGAPGRDGADGGHYTPSVSQPDPVHLQIGFTGSHPGMPPIDPVTVELPKGTGGDSPTQWRTILSVENYSPEPIPFVEVECSPEAREIVVSVAPDASGLSGPLTVDFNANGWVRWGQVKPPKITGDIRFGVDITDHRMPDIFGGREQNCRVAYYADSAAYNAAGKPILAYVLKNAVTASGVGKIKVTFSEPVPVGSVVILEAV